MFRLLLVASAERLTKILPPSLLWRMKLSRWNAPNKAILSKLLRRTHYGAEVGCSSSYIALTGMVLSCFLTFSRPSKSSVYPKTQGLV